VHVLQLLAMRLIGSRWKETKLARVDHVLDMLHASARKPLKGTILANAVHVQINLAREVRFSMCLQSIGRRPLKGTNLASAVPVLRMLAGHVIGSCWREIKLASLDHVLDMLALHLPGSC
jgi:hypothetical protein